MSETQITFQKVNEIVKEFIEEKVEYLDLLKQSLISDIELVRYVYAIHFPRIYSRSSPIGIKHKFSFDFSYHLWRNEKLLRPLPKVIVVEKSNTAAAVAGKDPASFEKRDNVNEFEQKPMIDKKYQPLVKKVVLSKLRQLRK